MSDEMRGQVPPDLGESPSDVRIVDDRVFVLGLDYLYRESMKRFERETLLPRARVVAKRLRLSPALGPVEGYYCESPELTSYFRLMRALQDVPVRRERKVSRLEEFRLLLDVTSSTLFGRAIRENLLPRGRDPLSQAMLDTMSWTVEGLVEAAHAAALQWDDFSLVGLAARIRDPVVMTAVRESVVLYAETALLDEWSPREYRWQVSDELVVQARRFVGEFDRFVPDALPDPSPEHAADYGAACEANKLGGRCVWIGTDDGGSKYHWAIQWETKAWAVDEFWSQDLWTTERYRSERLTKGVDLGGGGGF